MFYSLLRLESRPSHPHRSPCSLSPLSLPRGGWEGSNQHHFTEHTFPTRGGSLSPHSSPPTPPLLKTPASHRGQHPEDLPREAPGMTPKEPKGNLPRPDKGTAVLITRRSGSVFPLSPASRNTDNQLGAHTGQRQRRGEKQNASLPPAGVLSEEERGREETRGQSLQEPEQHSAQPTCRPCRGTSPPPRAGCRLLPSRTSAHTSPLERGDVGAKEDKWAPSGPL